MRVLESKIVEIDPTTGKMLMYQKIAGTNAENTDLPTNLCTGSEFFEIDTGTTLYFDETSSEWITPWITPPDDDGGDK